jgi:exonuclease VII small subunit
MPEPSSLFVKDVQVQGVLKALEDVCKESLHCLRVKAFLSTDCLRNAEDGYLLALDARAASAHSASRKTAPLLRTTQIGTAGYVVTSKEWHMVGAGEVDLKAHPDVDLDTSGVPCFTVPVLDIKGQTLACLQMVVGFQSPKVGLVDGREDSIDFEKAARWLVCALRAPLQLIMTCIGEDLNKSYTEMRRQSQRSFLQAIHAATESVRALEPAADELNEDDPNVTEQSKLFDELMKEMQDAQTRIADVVNENIELKNTVQQLQALYLNETRDKTIATAEGRSRSGSVVQRRSLDR